jgi:hypothetical protein
VSALSQSMSAFFELELLAAQAWSAAGDARRARAFARDLVDNPSAPDEIRMRGLDVLDKIGRQSSASMEAAKPARPSSHAPPLAPMEAATPIAPQPIVSLNPPAPPSEEAAESTERDPAPPPMSDVPVMSSDPPLPPSGTNIPSVPPPVDEPVERRAEAPRTPPLLPSGTNIPSVPPLVDEPVERRYEAPRTPPSPRPDDAPPELAELLSLPPGLQGQPPPRDAVPRTILDARAAFTHLSRELGRDYRARYGVELRTDVAGIEAMQRHLRERFAEGRIASAEDAYEIRRHGAFLSEILARRMGAYWIDIAPTELGHWAMVVPKASAWARDPSATRVWPFGRVLRFVAMGHKKRDLVGYYLEFESRARR